MYVSKYYNLEEFQPEGDKPNFEQNEKEEEENEFETEEFYDEMEDEMEKALPDIKTDDEFILGYDSADEEVTYTIMDYLHKNPHLFKKIRFLQRNNKVG